MSNAANRDCAGNSGGSAERPPTIGISDVDILIDGRTFRVAPGRHRVSDLKALAGIAAADELSQIVDGKLVLLQNDAGIVVRGGEQFVSNPPSGGSS